MIELYILGPAEIRNSRGELEHSFLAGSKRLALLTYLLLSRPRGFHRRDALLPLLWPELGQKSARNALSNMLYQIRKSLGGEAIENRGSEEVKVNPKALWSDALVFEQFFQEGNYQSALRLYRSDLLRGFHVHNISAEYDYWLEQERNRFRSFATEGSWALAEQAGNQQDYQEAKKWAKKAAGFNPFSEQTQIKLISFLDECGDQPAAMEAYQSFARLIHKEWDEEPVAELKVLADAIKTRQTTAPKPSVKENFSHPKNTQPSIAVLPFETLGLKKASAFTDAIYGSILTGLSWVKDLQVISRTSVYHYKNSDKSASEIGKELNVWWLLRGEVSEVGDEIRVVIWLVNAATEGQVWSNAYERKLTAENIFRIEGDIIGDILKILKVQPSHKEKQRVEQNPTKDLDAYRMYTQGRSNLDQRTESGIYQGLDCFQGCIELDPNYALAWSGLADALSLLQFYGFTIPKNSPDPLIVATKSVSLHKELGEAHASVGIVHSINQRGVEALKALEHAVHLTPGYAEALSWLGWLNLILGRPKKALETALQAVRLNPLAPAFRIFLSEIYLANGAHENALFEAKRAREINPDYGLAHYMEGMVLYHHGQMTEAVEAFRKALLLVPAMGTPSQAEVKTALAFTYYALGENKKAIDIRNQTYGRINPFSLALLHALFGEPDKAFIAFSRVQEWGSFSVEQIRYFFPEALAPLRKDKRFGALMVEINKTWGLLADGSLP